MRDKHSHQPSTRRTPNYFVLALLAAFVVLASACGGDADSESTSAQVRVAAPEPAAAPADEIVRLPTRWPKRRR